MPTIEKADLSRITVIPGQRSGQPCIRGLRITAWDLLGWLAAGKTEDQIIEDYPELEKDDFAIFFGLFDGLGQLLLAVGRFVVNGGLG